jgi:uncharacterized surface protein with fasciclin (FAS1) repeats
VTALALVVVGCGQQEPVAPTGPPAEKKRAGAVEPPRTQPGAPQDIVETAMAAGQFETLCQALEAADLVDTLKGSGPFTVFAPTDEAFGKLPPGTLDELLKPESKDQLVAVLTYLVVPGKVMAADVADIESAATVNGDVLTVKVEDDAVMVDGAEVIETDIECTNGVIHVIDAVLLP